LAWVLGALSVGHVFIEFDLFPKRCVTFALSVLLSVGGAFPVLAASGAGKLAESASIVPVKQSALPRLRRMSPLAEQASTGFSVLAASKGGASLQKIRKQPSGSLEDFSENIVPVCGQAAEFNTFGCWNLSGGEVLADIPIPGQLTTLPQYYDGSWFVGTSRGFFIRLEANGPYLTPSFGIDSALFHGPDARSTMKALSRRNVSITGTEDQSFVARFQGSWQWFATANAEFVGAPQFGNKQVYILTANQSLNSYDLESGKLNWSVRIAPEAQLRLATDSLLLTEKGLLVGTSDGQLILVDANSGQVKWRHSTATGSADRFAAIAAPPLLVGNSVIISNAESVTQRLNLDSKVIEWSFPVGSVAQSRYDEGFVFIAGSDGSVHKLDVRTGERAWRTGKLSNNVLVSVYLQKMNNVAFVSDSVGHISVLQMSGSRAGRLVGETNPSSFGPVVGEFFAGRSELNEICLSYKTPGLNCWSWMPDSSKQSIQ
jgi:outer membrane protein assembly factor BamB